MTTPKPKVQRDSRRWEPYPDLDLEPKEMEQIEPIYDLRAKLRAAVTPEFHYPYHPTILVGGEIPIYYGTARPGGGPPPHVIPDCLVAFNVDSRAIRERVGYDPIQNGKPPDWVMEVGSHSTYRNDSGYKREVYRQLRIPEYWRFDPSGGDYYGQAIIGEQLVNGQYEQFPLIRYGNGIVGVTSPILNLNFRWQEWRFRIHNPTTGEEYEHPQEENARLQEENAHLQERNTRLQERTSRLQERNTRMQGAKDRLQGENARLQAEIRRLRGE